MAELQIGCYWNPNSSQIQKKVERLTFWVLTARFMVAKSEAGSTVPRKIALNWFMPAFAKSRVGSDSGTTEDDETVFLLHQSGIALGGWFQHKQRQ